MRLCLVASLFRKLLLDLNLNTAGRLKDNFALIKRTLTQMFQIECVIYEGVRTILARLVLLFSLFTTVAVAVDTSVGQLRGVTFPGTRTLLYVREPVIVQLGAEKELRLALIALVRFGVQSVFQDVVLQAHGAGEDRRANVTTILVHAEEVVLD